MMNIRNNFHFQRPRIQGTYGPAPKSKRPLVAVIVIVLLFVAFLVWDSFRCARQVEAACRWADYQAQLNGR